MLIVWVCQALFGAAALVFCCVTVHAILQHDSRAHLWLTVAGSFALIFFVSVRGVRVEMMGVALLAIVAGILMAPVSRAPLSFDSTATRRRR